MLRLKINTCYNKGGLVGNAITRTNAVLLPKEPEIWCCLSINTIYAVPYHDILLR